jgi:hypothetical protein
MGSSPHAPTKTPRWRAVGRPQGRPTRARVLVRRKGEYDGWWEARIVGIVGDDIQLRWFGDPLSVPMTTHERKYVALLHPDYEGELNAGKY